MIPTRSYLSIDKSADVMVHIHVIPNASRTQADGTHDGALRVRLHAPPVDGKANQALIVWLAQTLDIAKSQITLVRGQTSKRKQLKISATAATKARWTSLDADGCA